MLQSFAKLLATDRGFRPEHVITAELDFSVSGFTTWVHATDTRPQVRLKELLERIRQLPGVQSAGAAYRFLRRDNRPPVNWPFTIFGRPPVREGERPTAEHNAISPGYFRALGIPLQRGRFFTDADKGDAPWVLIINHAMAERYWPGEDAVGKRITFSDAPKEKEKDS